MIMKKYTLIFLTALAGIAALGGCSRDMDDINTRLDNVENGLESANGRISALEETMTRINADLQTLQYLKGGIVINSAVGSDLNGWTLTLSNGTVINIYPKEASTNIPILSISEDGYWMADSGDGNGPQYVKDSSGNRVPATSTTGDPGPDGKDGVTPMLGVDSEGYWTVSYDNGTSWSRLLDDNGSPVSARVSVGDSLFSGVSSDGSTVTFTLNNGEVYKAPLVSDFLCTIEDAGEVQLFEAGETKGYKVTMTGIADAIALCPDGWRAVLSDTSLQVTAPAAVTKAVSYSSDGSVSILATSKAGFAAIAKMSVGIKEAPKEYSLYSEMWADGQAITIGDVSYSPADHAGWTTVQVTEDSAISSVGRRTNAIFFISEGVTLTWDQTFYPDNGAILFVGDKIGTRSSMVFSATLSPKVGVELVAFKNLSISAPALTPTNALVSATDGAVTKGTVDGCKVDLSSRGRFGSLLGGANGGWTNVTIVDSDFILPGSTNNYTDVSGAQIVINRNCAVSGGKFIFTNNLCYSADGSSPYVNGGGVNVGVASDLWAGNMSFAEIDMERNTFIGTFYKLSLITGATQLVEVGGTLSIKDNINYVSDSNGFAGYVKLVQLIRGYTDGVSITASNNWGWSPANYRSQTYADYSATQFSADPYTGAGATFNPAGGVFVLSTAAQGAAAGAGANR